MNVLRSRPRLGEVRRHEKIESSVFRCRYHPEWPVKWPLSIIGNDESEPSVRTHHDANFLSRGTGTIRLGYVSQHAFNALGDPFSSVIRRNDHSYERHDWARRWSISNTEQFHEVSLGCDNPTSPGSGEIQRGCSPISFIAPPGFQICQTRGRLEIFDVANHQIIHLRPESNRWLRAAYRRQARSR